MAATSTPQAMLIQGLFEEQEMHTQLGFLTFPPHMSSSQMGSCHQPLKGFLIPPTSGDHHHLPPGTTPSLATETLLLSPTPITKPRSQDMITSSCMGGGVGGGSQLLSLQRSSANLWGWGEMGECAGSKRSVGDGHLGVSAIKMKKMKSRRKVREPRFCFKTMSDVDVLDDGYKWRKYGQKVVKNTQHPRSYYRCTQDNCRVKKRVERLAEDPRMVITTYEGRHVHSPSHDIEDSQNPSGHLNNFLF